MGEMAYEETSNPYSSKQEWIGNVWKSSNFVLILYRIDSITKGLFHDMKVAIIVHNSLCIC